MKKSMKLLAFLLSFVMVLGLFPVAHAEEAPVLATEDEIVIYYTNDVHTYIDGELSYDNIAHLKAETKKQAKGVALVDAGDHIQGTAYGSMDKGETIIRLMNAADYDVATLGNHEFDYGMERALELTKGIAQYSYVSCNFHHEKNGIAGESVFQAYKVLDFDGVKVAFLGITTPESFTKSTPAYFQDENGNYIYGISGGADGSELYATVQTAIEAASAKADYVIGLAHLGDDPASKPWTSEEVIANTTGLDALIDGHSHSTVEMKKVADKDGNEVILTQTGEYFGAIGRMSITEGGIETRLIEEYSGSDAEVKAIKDEWMNAVDTQLGEVIGYAEVTLDNYDADGNRLVRKQETNTGDFCADALYYLFENQGMDVDVAIMNGGGVRNKSITGEISYKTCKEIHTFGNVACLQTITGQQLLDALEWGARDVGNAECGGFLQVSGITYEIHSYIPATVQKDEKGVWTGGPTGEYRVRNVKILQDGEYVDLDLNAKYNLAGYNYTLRDLGDGFAMFDGAVNVLDYVMEDYMVLANYVQSFPAGENGLPTITADSGYADVNGDGRITVYNESPYADDVVIYYTNDVHTYIDGDMSYDTIADLKTSTHAAEVLLVDAGDHIQGTAYGSMDKGETIIELMNAAGYDLATFGNHEFDYGMERALELTTQLAAYPYVSANFYHEKDGVPGDTVVDAYQVFEADNGVTVAIVGITTPETFTKSTPAYFQDENGNYIYGIAGGTDGAELYAAVQKAVDAASQEADVVIALAHLGDDPSSRPWTSEEVIANTTGLDALIDGHAHSTVPMKEVADKEGNTVILTQTGEYLNQIGRMVITAEGDITTELITHTGSDETVKAMVDAWMDEIDTQLGEVFGYTDIMFDNYDETGRLVRKQETNTGNFAADALYYLFDDMGLDVDVAIMNGGGVRNKSITGEISYKTCKEIHTFGNVACLQTITGQQLLDALEWGARDVGNAECGGFLQVSGITYEIHSYIPATVQKDEKGVWTGGPTGEYRVRNVKILQDGEYVDLDLNAQYNLAGYNYTLRDLGDGFAMFDGAVNVLDYVMEDYMVLANYVKSFPLNEQGLHQIPANDPRYSNVNGEGRIRNVYFSDVPVGSFYDEPVLWAVKKGITTGATADLFLPEREITRAEVVTFLWRAEGCPEATIANPFTDVTEADFYYTAVLWAYEKGITTGATDTEFQPLRKCTRAEVATFLWRLAGEPAVGMQCPFEDVSNQDFYFIPVTWAYANGIAQGMTETTFEPLRICNRAHVVTFLYRYHN